MKRHWWKMAIVAILLLGISYSGSSARDQVSTSRLDKRIDIDLDNKRVADALEEIEGKVDGDVKFVYSPWPHLAAINIRVKTSTATVREVIEYVCYATDLEYVVKKTSGGKEVVVFRRQRRLDDALREVIRGVAKSK